MLIASSLLNIAYLMPLVARAFFVPAPVAGGSGDADAHGEPEGFHEAPLFCLVPLCLTALGCFALFFFGDAVYRLLQPIVMP